jgi:hypothetical protein
MSIISTNTHCYFWMLKISQLLQWNSDKLWAKSTVVHLVRAVRVLRARWNPLIFAFFKRWLSFTHLFETWKFYFKLIKTLHQSCGVGALRVKTTQESNCCKVNANVANQINGAVFLWFNRKTALQGHPSQCIHNHISGCHCWLYAKC